MSHLFKVMAVCSIFAIGCVTAYAADSTTESSAGQAADQRPEQPVYYKVKFVNGKAILTRSTENPAVQEPGVYIYIPDEGSSVVLNGEEYSGPGLFESMTGEKIETGPLVTLVEKELESRQILIIDTSLQETETLSCSSGNCT